MEQIHLLDKNTIDKIAAGEVVDRPASVVKELCENAIDAGAGSISVEIADGGIKMIRITDNGRGIDAGQVKTAFLRHATSKIQDAADLSFIHTLGFRGEALSSIAAVSKMELYTKTKDSLTGIIYKLEGGEEVCFEEAGLPDGTTIIVRDLFYNTPARLKFLKTAKTEGGYITDIIEKIALSHPSVSLKFTVNQSVKLTTNGNGKLMDAIYAVYGRQITSNLLEVNAQSDLLSLTGYIGTPAVSRGNRSMETYFINGRYIKDKVIESAIEEAYKGYQMKGTFPFTVLNLQIEPELIDVNVHPSKMEIRFYDNEKIFSVVSGMLRDVITARETIPEAVIGKAEHLQQSPEIAEKIPEPFEKKRTLDFLKKYTEPSKKPVIVQEKVRYPAKKATPYDFSAHKENRKSEIDPVPVSIAQKEPQQETLFSEAFLSETARVSHRIVGVVFATYWIVEYGDQIFYIDQHAAHEKVLYEQLFANLKNGNHFSQKIVPPVLLTLDSRQEDALLKYAGAFESLGFDIAPFGQSDYLISAVPMDLYGLNKKENLLLMLDELSELKGSFTPELLLDKVATASCKAAVKGGNTLSFAEADALIDKLLQLENPYHCPHGRPTIIKMSKTELERKFKRLV